MEDGAVSPSNPESRKKQALWKIVLTLYETTRGPLSAQRQKSWGCRNGAQAHHLRDLKVTAASKLSILPLQGGEADSTLSFIFSFTHNVLLHCALVDILEIFIDYNIALFRGDFMCTHISLT